jgi:hypothetical protein
MALVLAKIHVGRVVLLIFDGLVNRGCRFLAPALLLTYQVSLLFGVLLRLHLHFFRLKLLFVFLLFL